MGFGSYDESEQANQEYDAEDLDEDGGVDTEENTHEGTVEFEFSEASNDELLNQLQEIKGE